MASVDDNSSLIGSDSEDDIDWEEVDVPQNVQQQQNLEITIQARPRQKQDKTDKKKGISHAERLIRIDCHKIHTVCLLANARIRNYWINDELLRARLLSLTPLALQNAFAVIHKSRVPDSNKRGRLFESAIESLTEWWMESFFAVDTTGHLRNRTFDEVQKTIAHLPPLGEQDILDLEMFDEEESELIRSSKSLMKHALMRGGSRDVSAQLFTSLCRALDIPARLVVSLQSVPWQAGVGKPKPKSSGKKKDVKGKGKEKAVDDVNGDKEGDDDDMEEVSIPSDLKGKGKAKDESFLGEGNRLDGQNTASDSTSKGKWKAKPIIKLRKQKPKGNVLGASSTPPPKRERTPDPTVTPPVFWTEVFSRADGRWLPVDPIRCIVNKRKVFDPSPTSSSSFRQENRMVYVVAFEEDGYARDVTPRYAREFGAKVAKVQGGSKSRKEWWERVANTVTRPYRLHRDDVEDEELQSNQMTEGMPTTMTGFKDHPLYVLTRHLKQNETIHPLVELGKFRGEPVYSRSSVLSLKAAENWMRSGRKIREGCQPMKWVKQRASTVGRRREIEMTLERGREEKERAGEQSSGVGEEEVLQGLYAERQTELYRPDPIIDGKIPKNDFGNIDLYVPSMLPRGAAHIPFKGVSKIARKLGFEHAEAVTGFEFRNRRALPIIEGVVVAAENEAALLEAYWEAEQEAEKKARIKREERVIKRWTRLVHGLRIRQRLQEQYAERPQAEERHWLDTQAHAAEGDGEDENMPQAGGYLTAADDVVEAFHLPKYQHVVAAYSTDDSPSRTGFSRIATPVHHAADERATSAVPEFMEDDDDDLNMEVIDISEPPFQAENGVPLSMEELATAANQRTLIGEPSLIDGLISSTLSNGISSTIALDQGNTSRDRAALPKQAPVKVRTSGRKRGREEIEKPPLDQHQPLPTKKRGKAIGSPTPLTTPTRTLRPRPSKSAARIQEEKEMEHAYRRAVAE